jgi:hypothetical protein
LQLGASSVISANSVSMPWPTSQFHPKHLLVI